MRIFSRFLPACPPLLIQSPFLLLLLLLPAAAAAQPGTITIDLTDPGTLTAPDTGMEVIGSPW